MSTPKVLKSEEGQWVVLGLVAVVVVYYVGKQLVGAAGKAATAAGGVVSGNNALTQGTEYEGTGVLGTLGAFFNSALGGAPSAVGDYLGGLASGDTGDSSAASRSQVVTPNYTNDIDDLLGDWD